MREKIRPSNISLKTLYLTVGFSHALLTHTAENHTHTADFLKHFLTHFLTHILTHVFTHISTHVSTRLMQVSTLASETQCLKDFQAQWLQRPHVHMLEVTVNVMTQEWRPQLTLLHQKYMMASGHNHALERWSPKTQTTEEYSCTNSFSSETTSMPFLTSWLCSL